MSFRPVPNTEPIPGYTLVERLGAGGYGEVWKANAPGGLLKAVKFIYGEMGDARAGQEVKAIQRIKGVRHPFLLSMERVEVVDGQLIIVTELADESLIDRFEKCRQGGSVGIDRETLLGYLRDVSDALDYMSETYGLQHLDIKPGNLLMVGGRVKVADFGLVKDVRGDNVTASGGVSPAYAAAEFFDGRVSRYSDQYSLAIVYQEMLTGVRPFPGTTAVQLALQHSTGKPMLDPLPVHDRPTIARALSKDPNERFPSCNEFVKALVEAPKPKTDEEGIGPVPGGLFRLSHETEIPTDAGIESKRNKDAETTDPLATLGPPLLRFANAAESDDIGREAMVVRPTLFLGLGGIGCSTLRQLRRKLIETFGSLSSVPMLRLLSIDTDRKELRGSTDGNTAGPPGAEETLCLPLHSAEHYRSPSQDVLRWLDRRWFFGMPKSHQTEGIRPLGRLALLDHADQVRKALTESLSAVQSPASSLTSLQRSHEPTRVVLISSISGGTGSGMIVDFLHLVRDQLERMKLPANVATAMLLHATSPKPAEKEIAQANAYATLTELNHCLRPDQDFAGEPSLGLGARSPQGELVRDCYVVHLGDDLGPEAVRTSTASVAEYLLLESVTSCGSVLDEYRDLSRSETPLSDQEATVRSFGLYRIAFPRQDLAEVVGRICCRRVLARWHGDLDPVVDAEKNDPIWSLAYRSRWLKELGEAEAMHVYESLAIQDKTLLGQFELTTSDLLQRDPDQFCQLKIKDLLANAPRGSLVGEAAGSVLRELDGFLGPGDCGAEGHSLARTEFETHVCQRARAHGEQEAKKIADWVRDTVENPERRLKAALAGVECLTHRLLARIETIQQALHEARTGRSQTRAKLTGGSSATGWIVPTGKSATLADLSDLSLEYCRSRLAEIGLETILECLKVVYRKASELHQKLMEARREISRLAESFLLATGVEEAPGSDPGSVACVAELLPGKSSSLLEAAMGMAKDLSSTSFFDDVDEQLCRNGLDESGGLWSILAGDSPIERLKVLLPKMLLAAVLNSLERVDAASLFFEHQSGMGPAIRRLRQIIEQAKPKLRSEDAREHLMLGVPNSPCGRTLRELVAAQAPGDAVTAVAVPGDVVFCIESAGLPIPVVAEQIIGGEPAFVGVGRRLLTRTDVDWPELHGAAVV